METNPLPIPEGLDVISQGNSILIRRRWFSNVVWFLLFFCIAWDSFLVFWYAMALKGFSHHGNHVSPELLAIIFPIAHVAVGIGLTYFVLCTFLNRTDIVFSSDLLSIRTRPLPWRGNKTLRASDDIVSFSTRERQRVNNRGASCTYDVLYVNTANREQTLLKGLPNKEQAEYISTTLSRFYFPTKAATLAS